MSKAKIIQNTFVSNDISVHYYEIKNSLPVLLMLHAQGTNALSFQNTFVELSKKFHIFAIDCPGHGLRDKNRHTYNIISIGNVIVDFIKSVILEPTYIVGHSSGGLIAAYTASHTQLCNGLILEDPPFFSCQGERRYKTFNYLDLSTVCHKYIELGCKEDFVLYYFENQKMWEFFPNNSREKIKSKLLNSAKKYRKKYPQKPLKVPFLPKNALAAYYGMNEYDPYFGESFYSDSFHADILHEDILKNISCRTLIIKAKTNYDDEGVLLAAMSDEDARRANELIPNSEITYFDCGHGVHIEKKKEFICTIIDFVK